MNLIHALYGIPFPKYNPNPKMRPHKLDNITLALKMVEDAHVKTNFLKSTHLIDKDLKMLLGMIWAIILGKKFFLKKKSCNQINFLNSFPQFLDYQVNLFDTDKNFESIFFFLKYLSRSREFLLKN